MNLDSFGKRRSELCSCGIAPWTWLWEECVIQKSGKTPDICQGLWRKDIRMKLMKSTGIWWNMFSFFKAIHRRDKVILIWVLAILTQCYQSLFYLLMFPKLQVTGNTDHKVNHILLLIIIYLLFHQILFSSVPQLKNCGQYSSLRIVLYTLPVTIAFHKYWYSAARLTIFYFTI